MNNDFKKGDVIVHGSLERRVYIYNCELGYLSSYGDFVALKDSGLIWKLKGENNA